MSNINKTTRQDLFDIYTRMNHDYHNLKHIINRLGDEYRFEKEAAKHYWLGEISSGIGCEDYVNSGSRSLEVFLKQVGIIDDDGCFIDEDEDEDLGN